MSVPLSTFSFADQTTNGLVGNPARCLEVASSLPARARMIFLFENVAADSRSDWLASEHHGRDSVSRWKALGLYSVGRRNSRVTPAPVDVWKSRFPLVALQTTVRCDILLHIRFSSAAPRRRISSKRDANRQGLLRSSLKNLLRGQNRVDQRNGFLVLSRRVGTTGERIFFSVTTSYREFIYRSKCWEIRKLVNLLVRGNTRPRFFSLADRRKYVRDPEMAKRRERWK